MNFLRENEDLPWRLDIETSKLLNKNNVQNKKRNITFFILVHKLQSKDFREDPYSKQKVYPSPNSDRLK